jgi:cytochrome c-type protein NapB
MMKNKVILSIAFSLAVLGFSSNVLAEETTPTATTIEKTVATTPTPEASKEVAVAKEKVAKKAPIKKIMPEFKGITSLRGENALNDMALATDNKQLPADSLPIVRNYFQQPPLIPHRIREYKITINNNKCMSCHSWKNYKKSRATKVSQTHFTDRDGNAQSTLAARRYFCTQCHVPQTDAKPLVENDFKPVSDLK